MQGGERQLTAGDRLFKAVDYFDMGWDAIGTGMSENDEGLK